MALAYIGLGANLGDPLLQLRAALDEIAHLEGVQLAAASRLYRSAPLGPGEQPHYCNAACVVETRLDPEALMAALIAIERAAGRVRGVKWGPRILDLDLLHYEGVVRATPGLRLPHPEIARRNFVLVPLAEIAPALSVPGIGSIAQAAAAAGSAGLEPWPVPA